MDQVLFSHVQAATEGVERLLAGVSWLGSVEVTAPVLVAACLAGRAHRRLTDPQVWAPVAVLALLVGVEVGCKLVLHQAPPAAPSGGDYELLGLRLPFTFPSGHMMRFTLVVGLLGFRRPGGRPAWFWAGAAGATGLLGLARVSAGSHWPTDVVGGILLGAAGVAALVALAAAPAPGDPARVT